MTNFNAKQFHAIWDLLKGHVLSSWNVDRGRKSEFKGKDVLFMTLTVLKHAGQWDFLARMFDVKTPTFERLIPGFINILWEPVYDRLVIDFGTKRRGSVISHNGSTFKNFKFALYATDVTFQQCNRPSGNIEEAKKYYSGKHKLYGYKVELSVMPNGFATFCSDHNPGSVSHIDIMYQMRTSHEVTLAKSQREMDIADVRQLSGQYPNMWAVLADKSYQGATEFLRCFSPKKKPRMGFLSADEERFNSLISSDRIIVEIFFGRLCQLWTIMNHKYRWGEGLYDPIFKLCLGLTNLHVNWYPLRLDDLPFLCESSEHDSCYWGGSFEQTSCHPETLQRGEEEET